jgi:hypothetical protein
MKKWWVKFLVGVGLILLAIAVWLSTSGLHSKNAVEHYKDQLRAAGEKLNIDELVPPRADPEKNGVELFNEACRYMNPSGAGVLSTNSPSAMRMVAPGKATISWQQSEIISVLGSTLMTNTWADIEQDLEHQKPALDLLQKVAEHPQLDFGLDYKKGPAMLLPHLVKVKQATLLLSPAAVDSLHKGDVAASVTRVHAILGLVNAWETEPLLISQLVRIALTQIAVQPQWELLQATNVTEQQLAGLQRDWQNLELVRPMECALQMERASISMTIQQFRSSNSPSGAFGGWLGRTSSGSSSGNFLDDLKDLGQSAKRKASDTMWRASWSYSDELANLECAQVLIEALRQIRTNGYFKDALSERDRKLAALGLNHPNTNWLRNQLDDELAAVFGTDTEGRSLERLMTVEAARRIVITSIALKRYQLRHGVPALNLESLVPQFLSEVPRDQVDGKPLRYRLKPDGTFLLYSIGQDYKDDGGDPTPTGSSATFNWLRARDWVWAQPATEQEIQNYYAHPPK